VGFYDWRNIDRRSSGLDDGRRVYSSMHDSAFSRAVGNFRPTARDSDFLGAIHRAGFHGNRGDRSSHLNGLRLGET
jgi:hypothetical protein